MTWAGMHSPPPPTLLKEARQHQAHDTRQQRGPLLGGVGCEAVDFIHGQILARSALLVPGDRTMFGWDDLKEHMAVTPTTVQCPLRECSRTIRRQQKTFSRSAQFRCPDHAIYVSASTFEYEQPSANMLWSEPEDLELWKDITQPKIKRESRVTRDNTEDAVTWNVFRYLEKAGLLARFISEVGKRPSQGTLRIVYWSWCQQTRQAWQPLVQAALGFGEASKRRSEPDLIIEDDATVFFVETKALSDNK